MSPEDVPEDLMLTARDIAKAGFCITGQRRWFPAYGFDFRDVLRNGVKARDLLATGDAYAIRAVTFYLENSSHG